MVIKSSSIFLFDKFQYPFIKCVSCSPHISDCPKHFGFELYNFDQCLHIQENALYESPLSLLSMYFSNVPLPKVAKTQRKGKEIGIITRFCC